MLQSSLAAFVASLGFGVIFNVRGKKLLVAALCGAIGGFAYECALYYHCSEVIALLLGAMALSIFSEIASRKLKSPVTTFIVCALIPLVPGGGMYDTMIEMVKGDVMNALIVGTHAIVCAGSIAIGCTLVSSSTRFYYKLKWKRNGGSL